MAKGTQHRILYMPTQMRCLRGHQQTLSTHHRHWRTRTERCVLPRRPSHASHVCRPRHTLARSTHAEPVFRLKSVLRSSPPLLTVSPSKNIPVDGPARLARSPQQATFVSLTSTMTPNFCCAAAARPAHVHTFKLGNLVQRSGLSPYLLSIQMFST